MSHQATHSEKSGHHGLETETLLPTPQPSKASLSCDLMYSLYTHPSPRQERPHLVFFYHLLRTLYIAYIALLSISFVYNSYHILKPLPTDPHARALYLLTESPIIDGHIDLPILAREYYRNQLDDIELGKKEAIRGQVDIPRLREGKVGGFFWSTYVPCDADAGFPIDDHGNFTNPTNRVRDTLEQIDIAKLLIQKYSKTFELTLTSSAWVKAMRKGKIGGMLGVEGGHQLGSSLSSLRAYYELGARYVTMTHTCHNALADSCGMQGTPIEPRWNGLSEFGKKAIKEMNRLGMIVDLSHTSPATTSQALSESKAPVIFSHSNARGVHSVVRNVADSTLRRIGKLDHPNRSFNLSEDGEKGQGWGSDTGEVDLPVRGKDALIMLNFSPAFISETEDGTGRRANIKLLADHADYIGSLAGRRHVGIGSDYDGIAAVPVDLPDVSTYPLLVAELIRRGWSDKEVKGLASDNLLRILRGVEKVKKEMRSEEVVNDIFDGRTDMKGRGWGRA